MYAGFDTAPTLLVKSLLFIENRELLDPTYPKRNPAVEWDRFSKAVFDKSLHVFTGGDKRSAGGSTLATQIEKYRHSPDGRTNSLSDKLRQMVSATLRAYQGGEDTTEARRQIVVDYINTVPLSAKVGYGEVNGIGDGMWVWYGRDFADLNRALKGSVDTPEAALAYKQALSLFIAQRRPAHYLGAGAQDLEELTNTHLRVLTQAGIITPQLRDLASQQKLHPASGTGVAPPAANSFVTRKASNAVRTHLAGLLGDSRLYNVDRLDLTVASTLNSEAQKAVTERLRGLRDTESATAAGLTGKGMLGNGNPANVVYSFTLIERGADANYLRVQTDNYDQPLDINEGAKLDLGSTAKLRALVTYMDIVEQLHQRYEKMSAAELKKVAVDPKDNLSRWGVDYFLGLKASADRSLPAMLEAAMERKYSGSPGEGFFTGGGLHHFGNFSKLDDSRILTVRQALRNSTNLVFVRLMRDVVRYYMFQLPGSSAALLADSDDPRRAEYLARFADREGREFLGKFFNKYKGKSAGRCRQGAAGELPADAVAPGRGVPHDLAARHARAVRRLHQGQPAIGQRSAARAHRQDVRDVRAGQHVAGRPRLRVVDPPARTVGGRLPAHPPERRLEGSVRRQRQGAPGSLFVAVQHAPQACPGQAYRRPDRSRSVPQDPRPMEKDGLSVRLAGAVVRDRAGRLGRPAGRAGRNDGHHRQRRPAQAGPADRLAALRQGHAVRDAGQARQGRRNSSR